MNFDIMHWYNSKHESSRRENFLTCNNLFLIQKAQNHSNTISKKLLAKKCLRNTIQQNMVERWINFRSNTCETIIKKMVHKSRDNKVWVQRVDWYNNEENSQEDHQVITSMILPIWLNRGNKCTNLYWGTRVVGSGSLTLLTRYKYQCSLCIPSSHWDSLV